MTRHQPHADFDEAWTERHALVVRGRAPSGAVARLAPRRYKSPPAWAVVDIVWETPAPVPDDHDAPSSEFRLTCPLDALGATAGLCVAGRRHRCLIPLPQSDPAPTR